MGRSRIAVTPTRIIGVVMLVALFKGEFQYDAVNCFTDQLAASFRGLGFDARIIDMVGSREGLTDSLNALCDATGQIFCLFGFNALGSQIQVNGEPLHEVLGVPFVSWILDHPSFHLDRLHRMVDQPILSIDRNHVAFLQKFGLSHVSYAPHGAALPSPDPIAATWAERPGALLFSGSLESPTSLLSTLTAVLAPHDPFGELQKVFFELSDQADLVFDSDVEQALKRHPVIASYLFEDGLGVGHGTLLQILLRYRRASRRLALLDEFDRLGVAVDVCGSGWIEGRFRHHRHLGVKSFSDVLALFRRYRFVLNLNPMFGNGLHDRVVHAMASGAVACSESNVAIAAELGEGRGIVFDQPEAAAHAIARLEADYAEGQAMVDRAYRHFVRYHHWDRRAEQILGAVRAWS
ncbi:putative Glycosyltransferase family 1 protein [Azospirillaceae bacterium]